MIAKRKFSWVWMQHMGATIAHLTDLPHIVMSTRKHLLHARTWNIKATVACLANEINCNNTESRAIY